MPATRNAGAGHARDLRCTLSHVGRMAPSYRLFRHQDNVCGALAPCAHLNHSYSISA